MKQANATRTIQWGSAAVSGIRSTERVEVDDVPYHVSHVSQVQSSKLDLAVHEQAAASPLRINDNISDGSEAAAPEATAE